MAGKRKRGAEREDTFESPESNSALDERSKGITMPSEPSRMRGRKEGQGSERAADRPLDPSVNGRKPRPLETKLILHTNIAILKEVHTIEDLHAFIKSSPDMYRAFLDQPAQILLSVVSHQLGPVLRDAIALSYTENLNRSMINDKYLQNLVATVEDYRVRRWHTTPRRAVSKEMANLRCDWEMSVDERRGIAQAFFRLQFFMNAFSEKDIDSARTTIDTLSIAFGFFQVWEMERVSLAAELVAALLSSALPWSRSELALYYINFYYMDLAVVRRLLLAKFESVTGDYRLLNYSMGELGPGIMNLLGASHGCGNGPLLFPQPANTTTQWRVDAPYGWIDALNEVNTDRWGWSLIRGYVRAAALWHTSLALRIDFTESRYRICVWRWLGCVFWDKRRIEAMKSTDAFEFLQTGFITKIWERWA
ncbi:hypothetical protein BDZ45DRAFT_775406 [Acephala macrosclerotiorum]|nr:hypothetical protein BDZ45DRAFT_775406 [Acephala macrosclerotiorum]